MNITVNQELLAYIDPLTAEKHNALERSLLAEGCRDALVLWGEVWVDGQVDAVAGDKKELQQAARQVREAKAVARTEPESPEGVIARLKQTVTALSAQNAVLGGQLAPLAS